MRLLILTQHYDPEPIPKPAELARALVDRGHQVTVVCGFPNYPSGRLYPGYRQRLWQWDRTGPVDILRVAVFPYHGSSLLPRLFNYGSYMVTCILGGLIAPRCDAIYVLHPPLMIGLSAIVLSLLKRAPFVYDVQDIWPDSIMEAGQRVPPLGLRLLDLCGRWVYRRAAAVLAITHGARSRLVEKGAPPHRVIVPRLWVSSALFDTPASRRDVRSEFGLKGRFLVMFAGNLGVVQALDTLIDAAERLKDEDHIVMAFVGDGVDRPRLEEMARRRGLDNVRFLGGQPFSSMPDFLSTADALVVHLKRGPLTSFLVPAKILAYLAVGRPLIAALHGPGRDLVLRASAGLAVEPEDPAGLANAIRELEALPEDERRRLGNNGRTYLLRHNSPQQLIDEYESILSSVRPARADAETGVATKQTADHGRR